MKPVPSLLHFYAAEFLAVLIFTLATGCAPESSAPENPPAAAADAGARVFDTMGYRIRVVTIAEGMTYPHSLAFLPDGGMLVTQLGGDVRLIRNGTLVPEPVGRITGVFARPGAGAGSGGLMDIVLHPNFAENHLVYFDYNKEGPRGTTMAVARGTFDGAQLTDITDIFVAEAWDKSDGHLSSRIAFGGDGMLYMAISDRGLPERAQKMDDHIGKVLRLRDDGTVPDGNPFAGRTGYRPEIFTYGHRNLHGMAIHPETGDVWVNEHGDEVNLLKAGANYGWPYQSIAGAGGGNPISPPPPGIELAGPYISWNPALNISGLTFYNGDRFPNWKGNMFVGGLSTQQVQRVEFSDSRPGVREPSFTQIREALFTQIGQRVRDLKQGPDGLIYFTTYDATSGAVMRIEPAG